MSYELLAKRYSGMICSLDGKPAVIDGQKQYFATISQLPTKHGPGLKLVFSWYSVHRVMNQNRIFMSK